MVEVSSIKTNMKPSNLQKLEIQRVTILELQAQVAELKSQNSELIKKSLGMEHEKQELADEVLRVKTINSKLKKNLNLTQAWNDDLQNTVCFLFYIYFCFNYLKF